MAAQDSWWPDQDPQHAAACDDVVEAEHAVTRAVEALAAQRRALPVGSLVRDYEFLEGLRDIHSGDRPSAVAVADLSVSTSP